MVVTRSKQKETASTLLEAWIPLRLEFTRWFRPCKTEEWVQDSHHASSMRWVGGILEGLTTAVTTSDSPACCARHDFKKTHLGPDELIGFGGATAVYNPITVYIYIYTSLHTHICHDYLCYYRLEAIASRLEAIAIRLEAIASILCL